MEQLVYIKTTSFGGYDKAETNAALEKLYSQIYELENKVKEDAALLEGYKKGQKEQTISEEILSENKKMLAETKAKLQSLMDKEKQMEAEITEKDQQISDLSTELELCKEELEKANKKSANSGNSAESLSKVFIEAQKSADMLVEDAKKQSANMEVEARKLAETIVAEANETAAHIIAEAEKEAVAAEKRLNETKEALKVSSSNLKTVMFSDIKAISSSLAKLKETLSHSEDILNQTTEVLTADGIPEFVCPPSKESSEAELNTLMDMATSIGNDTSTPIANAKDALDIEPLPKVSKI